MIGIHNELIEDIPVLVVEEIDEQNIAKPLVIYVHGFTRAKEDELPIAYLLAERGFRVVLPDCLYHGARESEISELERQLNFWNIIRQNLKDIYTIKSYFTKDNLILDDKVLLSGTSMGGITTAAALTQFDWIHSAAILMGTAKHEKYAKLLLQKFGDVSKIPLTENELDHLIESIRSIDLSKQMDCLRNRPLLIWHGDQDPVIPHDDMTDFFNEAKQYYDDESNIRFLSEKGRGHKVSRKAILATVDWFSKQFD